PVSRRLLLVVGLLVAAVVGYAVFKFYVSADRTVEPPEIPADVTDPPIHKVIAAKRAAVVADPRSATAWGALGMAFDAHERWDQSQACYERAMELAPSDAQWPFLIAEQLNWRRKVGTDKEEAVRLYRIAAERSPPTRSHAWIATLSLADLLTELDRTDEAAPLYQQAFEADPTNPWAVYRMAGLLAERGQTADAIRMYHALARNPYARKKSIVALAELHRRLGKTKDADEYEHAAALLPPDVSWANPYADPVAELRRGKAVLTDTYFALEKAQDVQGVMATATALADQYPSVETQLLLLRATVNTGDFAAAVAVADDVLRVQPDAVTAHSFLGLARLGLADRAEAEGRKTDADRLLAQAAESLGESVRLKPDYAPGHLYRAKALLRLGRLQDAEKSARAGVASRPEEWEVYLVLSDVLAASDRKPEAIAAAEQAVKLAPPNELRATQALDALKKK
ncbi:MAG TPA: tetratricopeptide repeat protein, partial [Gemmataceae bacterium]|nr:tetratricopeptide repeat protein [Gemmataceae bacterium]